MAEQEPTPEQLAEIAAANEESEAAANYKAPAQKSLQEIQELDKDDDSLRRYKEALLGKPSVVAGQWSMPDNSWNSRNVPVILVTPCVLCTCWTTQRMIEVVKLRNVENAVSTWYKSTCMNTSHPTSSVMQITNTLIQLWTSNRRPRFWFSFIRGGVTNTRDLRFRFQSAQRAGDRDDADVWHSPRPSCPGSDRWVSSFQQERLPQRFSRASGPVN